MLPPGHIAAGYLVTEALLHIAKPDVPPDQLRHLLYWGMFFSFAPDLDNFVAYTKIRSWWYKPGVDSSIHRKFYSHIPLFWLVAGLMVYFLADGTYVKYIGLLLWIGSWTHFILDSIDGGIMWLWPFNTEVWALRNRGIRGAIQGRGFFDYWYKMVRIYMTRWTFYTEVAITLAAIIYLIRF
jgi:hypothetical protein